MKKWLSVAAALAVAVLGGVLILGAAPPAPQDESKSDKIIKALNERVEKLEKRVAELEKKLAQRSKGGGFDDALQDFLERFGRGFEEHRDGLKKRLEEFRENMPEMPDFEGLPDQFEGQDLNELFDMLKGQLENQLPGLFENLDLEKLFEQFKESPERKSEPKKGKRREV